MSKETMKLALAVLEGNTTNPVIDPEQAAIEDKAITALREALAEQPAQQDEFKAAYIEAMVASNEAGFAGMSAAETIRELSRMVAEQPARQEPVGRLESDPDEGHVFVPRIDGDWSMLGEDLYTSPQPAQQEPVAYAVYHRMGGSKSLHWPEQHSPDGDASQYQLVPLCTSSQAQRKPLTDEQIEEVWRRVQSSDFHDCVQPFARAIEAAHGIKENT